MRREQTFWKQHQRDWDEGDEGPNPGSTPHWFCDSRQIPILRRVSQSPPLRNRLVITRIREENETKQPKLQCLARGRHLDDRASAVPSLSCGGRGGHVFGDGADLRLQRQGSKPLQRIGKGGEMERRGSRRGSHCIGHTGCRGEEGPCTGPMGCRGEEGHCPAASPVGMKPSADCHLSTPGCAEPANSQESPKCLPLLEMHTRFPQDPFPFPLHY